MGDKPKCFVPDCKNSVGVLFPKNQEVRKKWLVNLELEHLLPEPKSFICLDHFKEDGQPGLKNKRRGQASRIGLRNTGGSSSFSVVEKITSVQKSQDLTQETRKPPKTYSRKDSTNSSHLKTSDIQEDIENHFQEAAVHCAYEKMCRLCRVQSTNVTVGVFKKFDDKHTIAHVISICLYPLKILPNDGLSQHICKNCKSLLQDYFEFHQSCIANNTKHREIPLAEQNEQHSDGNYPDSDHSDEYLHEERLSDYEENKENKDDFRPDNTNGKIANGATADLDNNVIEKNPVDKVANLPEVSLKKKYDKGNEELLKVLEGNDDVVVVTKIDKNKPKVLENSKQSAVLRSSISESNDESYCDAVVNNDEVASEFSKKDGGYTENIIIEMVNDEPAQNTSSLPVDTSKLPITIRRVTGTSPTRKSAKRKLDSSRSSGTKRNLRISESEDNEEVVVIPSGISVAISEPYHSEIGLFKSEAVKYLFNSEYLMAGGYVYEFGLIKDSVRSLHCIVKKCTGTAHQPRLNQKQFLENVEVIVSHNHEAPSKVERKKQMFYHILYGKMRRDKNFNFKILYEQFCTLDRSLADILPLRSVIREICKQGPVIPPPALKSFDEFYAIIERDDFHKVHFTDNRVQFYQNRFESDDGAKAVVFGNEQVIEKYSHSSLMYVDASFVIDSDEFPYQLVTVLLWVDQSYYPVLHAFVSEKSQEIYMKIFNYLYSELAPCLRPHEIITDYEANLYYALGEIYVDSSIGGSMFYFTQNIYKKICALDLARELELNSNFRSIYNMLLMLPLLPVNTILDGLNNIETQAKELEIQKLTDELFKHVRNVWMCKVTPELFCVHRLENRINENIVAPFKKLRDFILLSRNKGAKTPASSSIIMTIEKLIDLEAFLRETYENPSKRSITKDLSSTQKKIILKAWNYIENHPMININQFFLKVLGYIKCMENQLWIWGFYRYKGKTQDTLIDANNFSIVNDQVSAYQEQLADEPMEEDAEAPEMASQQGEEEEQSEVIEEYYIEEGGSIRKIDARESSNYIEELADEAENAESQVEAVVMEAVIDENGTFVLQDRPNTHKTSKIINYVYK